MTIGNAFIRPEVAGGDGVIYLRVSDPSQVKTDYDPEGNSIPAQRKANQARADELNIIIREEFIDPGKSAKSIEGREAFKEMIAYLKSHRNIKYVVVYALSRTARNRYDDAILMMTLEKLGVKLISATERNLDDSPAGKAMHGFIAVMNQYRSDIDGEDIKYKMGQKVIAKGGSIGVAKVGYLNVRDTSEGREIRTIAVDDKRAPLILEAFTLFATGDYTEETLHEIIVDRGLTMRATYKKPERPIAKSTFGEMLRNRYYLGEVKYKGVWHPGRHQAIIPVELFDRVQDVLDSHGGSGIRTRKHHHYLKGAFWCNRCGSRFGLHRAHGNGGIYYYFFCHASRRHECDQPYVPLEDLERETEKYFARVKLGDAFREAVAAKVDATLLDELTVQEARRKRVTTRLKEIDQQENGYLALIGHPDWPQDKLTAAMAKLKVERKRLNEQLEQADESLEVGRKVLTEALALLANPQELYRQSDEAGKRLLTLTLFGKLYVDTYSVTGHELNEPFAALVSAEERRRADGGNTAKPRAYLRRTAVLEASASGRTSKGAALADSALDKLTLTELVDLALLDHGSDKAVLVEPRGIEPLTPALQRRCSAN